MSWKLIRDQENGVKLGVCDPGRSVPRRRDRRDEQKRRPREYHELRRSDQISVECELFTLFPLCLIIFVITGSIGLPGKTRMNPHNLLL